ncbi:MAG: type II toxin-antitoxin system HicB family antitoxin [Candidatus Dadabacteria bacterium]|nr:type II toxin-antitoxin system HicB family antitoxin [Candidatus Dadabacteria bacterium]
MTFSYPARIVYSKADKVYEVDFPDLPGCVTFGDTSEDAQKEAASVLTGYLESVMERGIEFSPPSPQGPYDVLIEPEKSVAFALWLRTKRKASGMTLADVADRLGVSYQVYQRLEDPAKTNPTLKTIAKLERVFGDRLVMV